jgi:hypothetical protein
LDRDRGRYTERGIDYHRRDRNGLGDADDRGDCRHDDGDRQRTVEHERDVHRDRNAIAGVMRGGDRALG